MGTKILKPSDITGFSAFGYVGNEDEEGPNEVV